VYRRYRLLGSAALLTMAVSGCRAAPVQTAACSLDDHAREYVELVAALGVRDPLSVDGPRPPPQVPRTAGLLISGAHELRAHLETVHAGGADAEREAALAAQLRSIEARAAQLTGARLSFADESERLLGGNQEWPSTDFEALGALEAAVPGEGTLADRLVDYDRRALVPASRLPIVMSRALAACREATARHIRLPAAETIDVSYVVGSLWSGYSRYAGQFRSTFEINTRLPLTVDRVLDLACHEGYPGHHALNVLRDEHLRQGRGWAEVGVMPTFSPESYRLEALASAAPTLAFSDAERVRFERDVLFPLAGLNPDDAEAHVRIGALLKRLDPDVASLTRDYLIGSLNHLTAPKAFKSRGAMANPEATLAFIDRYRAYSTAYTAGRFQAWKRIGEHESAGARWQAYVDMALDGRDWRLRREKR
jgi:hypothetical protein